MSKIISVKEIDFFLLKNIFIGFIIFCFSSFGGTIALGWLTSVTLLVATITNLVLLPVLLLNLRKK